MTIVCDVDCVLNDMVQKIIAMHNANNNKNIQISDITSYYFSDCLEREDAEEMLKLFNQKELWDSLEPIQDSQWGLRTLIDQGYDVFLATATHHNSFAWSVEWLKHYFPFINTNKIMCIQSKGLLKCDIMIEDCMEQLTRNVCDRVCLDYPWNRSTSKDYAYNIYRCKNWTDIVNTINKIERKDKEWEKR